MYVHDVSAALTHHHRVSHTEGNQDLFFFQANCLKRTTIKINKGQKKLLQGQERAAKCTKALSKHSCNIPSLPRHSEGYESIFNKAT